MKLLHQIFALKMTENLLHKKYIMPLPFHALSFYYEVGEFVQKADTLDGKIVNVNGTILKGSTIWVPEKARLTFKLADKNASITVVSNQGMPGNYKEDIPAVVTGIFINGTFEATQVITKC